MSKASIYVSVLLIAAVSVGGLGYYLGTMDSSGGSEGLEAVKSSSSFDKLSDDGEVDIRSYKIGSETISVSEDSDYPYNWTSEGLGNKRSTFVLAADFASFKEVESRLVIANSSRGAHIYQLQGEDILNDISGARLLSEVNQARESSEESEICSESTVSVERASIVDGSFSVDISVSGELARWIHLDLELDSETVEKDGIIDPSETKTFTYDQVERVGDVESISLSADQADDCSLERTIAELPVE